MGKRTNNFVYFLNEQNKHSIYEKNKGVIIFYHLVNIPTAVWILFPWKYNFISLYARTNWTNYYISWWNCRQTELLLCMHLVLYNKIKYITKIWFNYSIKGQVSANKHLLVQWMTESYRNSFKTKNEMNWNPDAMNNSNVSNCIKRISNIFNIIPLNLRLGDSFS